MGGGKERGHLPWIHTKYVRPARFPELLSQNDASQGVSKESE